MTKFFSIVVLFAAALYALPALAQVPAKHQNLDNGLALHGYDAVSYVDDMKAQKGKAEFAATYEGATYRFATAAHKAAFEKNPAKYQPAYGGWCAYAMGATGEKVDFDPETFKVENGKLYLFYNAFFNNTLPKWNKDEAKLKPAADKNWDKLLKQ